MSKNKVTLSDIEDIIYSHFEADDNFLMVVDFETALHLCNYTKGWIDEEVDYRSIFLDNECDEYYFSMYFHENQDSLFCEFAKTKKGEYKLCESEYPVSYYVFTDMNSKDVYSKLKGDNVKCWLFSEIVDEEDTDFCADCEGCADFEESECCEDFCSEGQELLVDYGSCGDAITVNIGSLHLYM